MRGSCSRRHLGVLLCTALAGARAEPAQRVLVPNDVLQDFERFLDGRDPLQLQQFGGVHARRDVVELALLLQAQGLVQRAYQQSGFFHPAVAGWKRI